jgi:hypothetical membrane protein
MSTLSATPTTSTPHHRWPVTARFGAAGIATFFSVAIVTAAVTPGYRSTRDGISALAALDSLYAWVMIAGFLAAAAGLVATGVGLWQRFSGVRSGRIGAGLVVFAGSLMATAGLARQDCSDIRPECIDHGDAPLASTHYWVHQYVSLALFLILVIAMFVLVRAARRTEGFGHLAIPTRIVAIAGLLLTVSIVTIGYGDVSGLVQRPYLAMLFGWPVLLAGLAPRAAR